MPKRSNDFQKLIYLIKQHVAKSSKITESKFLTDRLTDSEREVDICIEDSLGGHPITISIECINHKRKASVKWVEEMKGKHERLPTNALVLVSKSGFSKEAKKVSQKYGIETLIFDEIDAKSVDRLFSKTDALFSRVFSLTPLKVVIRVEEINGLPAENVASIPDNIVFKPDGTQLGTIKDYIESMLKSELFIKNIASQGNENHKSFEALIEKPIDNDGIPLCLRKENPLVLRNIESIKITGKCEISMPSRFPLVHGKLGNVRVSWGSGKFLEKDALLVVTEDDAGEKKLTITGLIGCAPRTKA